MLLKWSGLILEGVEQITAFLCAPVYLLGRGSWQLPCSAGRGQAGQAGQLSPRAQVGPFSLPHPGAEVLKVSGVAAGRLVASGAAWGQGCWEGKEN